MLMSPTLTGLSISSSIVVSVLVLLSSEAVGAVVLVPLLEHAASETAVAAAITPANILLKLIIKTSIS